MQDTIPIITIDGPSGSGKGTISQRLAHKYNLHFLDSGVVYRALALAILDRNIEPTALAEIESLALNLDLEYVVNEGAHPSIYLDKRDVTDKIRSAACSEMASKVSTYPEVRKALLERQRDFNQFPGLVADGRDMGTVVFPHAGLKIFLIASLEERAKRRHKQLQEIGINVSLYQILQELTVRDKRDEEREVAPLKPAADAIVIDTTDLSIEEVLGKIEEKMQHRFRHLSSGSAAN